MKVTKEMIGAAHDICLKKGDFVLSADLLERIYLAMDALANHTETSDSLKDQLAALQAENEKLREDAERYRWLRERVGVVNDEYHNVWMPTGRTKITEGDKAETDAAIDAAMKGEK